MITGFTAQEHFLEFEPSFYFQLQSHIFVPNACPPAEEALPRHHAYEQQQTLQEKMLLRCFAPEKAECQILKLYDLSTVVHNSRKSKYEEWYC